LIFALYFINHGTGWRATSDTAKGQKRPPAAKKTRRLGVPGLERRSDKPTDGQARAMLASLSTMFTWLTKRRIVKRTPCSGISRPDVPRARDRVLNATEMAKFWEAASAERTEVAVVLKCHFDNALSLLMNFERPTTCRYYIPYVVGYVVLDVEGGRSRGPSGLEQFKIWTIAFLSTS
jgi:hypothetical protein